MQINELQKQVQDFVDKKNNYKLTEQVLRKCINKKDKEIIYLINIKMI